MRTSGRRKLLKQLWKIAESEIMNLIHIEYSGFEQDVLILQNQMEDEFTAIGRTPNNLPRNLVTNTHLMTTISTQQLTISTSPMKRLRISQENNAFEIPLLKNIQKKCKMEAHNSSLPTTCIINGEQYNLQAIIATPINNTHQTLYCQTSSPTNSQGREIQKGVRYVGTQENQNIK